MYIKILIIPFLLILSAASSSYSDIYKYVDRDGVAYYTNYPQGDRYRNISGGNNAASSGGLYYEIIERTASKYNIEPLLVKAIISVESGWEYDAVSRRGAIGLMQLMPGTAEEMQVMDPFDPEENIEGGVRYLRMLLDRFHRTDLALAAYNAGPQRVQERGGIPAIKETRNYVKKVLALYNGPATYSGTDYGNGQSQLMRISMKKRAPVYITTP